MRWEWPTVESNRSSAVNVRSWKGRGFYAI
jgi:hypothetical protein